jgi:hypothetical protein
MPHVVRAPAVFTPSARRGPRDARRRTSSRPLRRGARRRRLSDQMNKGREQVDAVRWRAIRQSVRVATGEMVRKLNITDWGLAISLGSKARKRRHACSGIRTPATGRRDVRQTPVAPASHCIAASPLDSAVTRAGAAVSAATASEKIDESKTDPRAAGAGCEAAPECSPVVSARAKPSPVRSNATETAVPKKPIRFIRLYAPRATKELGSLAAGNLAPRS